MNKKKCPRCGEVKYLKDYYKDERRKSGYHVRCKECERKWLLEYRNTEIGYLKHRYDNMRRNFKTQKRGRKNKRYFTLNEFIAAFQKHKSIYGMRSAWGPGPKHLDDHLPITMIVQGTRRRKGKKLPRQWSNLSADRLDSDQDYTLQNLIFIRNDENLRKNRSTYEDCKIQIRLHEERFKNEIQS
jgi:hypothetical protein